MLTPLGLETCILLTSYMLLIIEIATGVVLGGSILYWLFSPDQVARRRERKWVDEFGRQVHEAAELQKKMTPEEREAYLRQSEEENKG